MWYNAGTITVAAGSVDVVGNGTAFVGNVDTSHALIAPDGRIYEIAQVVSATALKLVRPYAGGGAANVGYDILPTQVNLAGMTIRLDELLATFRVVRDTIGQGMFPDGTIATPGIRYSNDQDTGLARYGPNLLSAVTGGVERMRFGDTNSSIAPLYANDGATVQRGGAAGSTVIPLDIFGALGGAATMRMRFGSAANVYAAHSFIEAQTLTGAASDIRFGTSGVERARIDNAGNLLINCGGYNTHTVENSRAQNGTALINFNQAGGIAIAAFYAIDFNGVDAANGANAAFKVGRSSTGRSLNATGTGNFTGSDYAEYMVKATGCGTIAKGDVCGVDRDGQLTKTWADAVSCVIKSTAPSLVGGDTWDAEVGPKPEQPGTEPAEPSPPVPPAEDADEATIAAGQDAMAAYPAQVASYQTARAEWQKATDAYAKALPVWEAAHEKARQCVDRIAFCGQVPVNADAETLAACEAALADGVAVYLVAVARGAGIGVVAVREQDMTLPQYMRRVGKVWAIRDGRPWVDVQHG